MPDALDDAKQLALTQAAGPCPCDGCASRARCAAALMACDAYAGFLHGFPEWRWMAAPRRASTARFAALFDADLEHPAAPARR